MKLVDLNPRWVGHGGEGHYDKDMNPLAYRDGVGISFDCPCGCSDRTFIPFKNPIGGGVGYQAGKGNPEWQRRGVTFETLTLTPSIQRTCNCKWHGFLTDGIFKSV